MSPGMIDTTATINDTALPAVVPESSQTPANAPSSQLFSLKGTTIVITGAGRGVGIVLAGGILEAGGHVACIDILNEPSPTEWEALLQTAKLAGLHVSYNRCDITNEQDLQRTMENIDHIAQDFKAPLSGVIACAGVQQRIPALEYPMADFERIQRINVTGTFLTVKHAAKIMVKRKTKGSIVMIASMSGSIANRGLPCTAYNTSKAALLQMCRSLAQEWGQYGIRVNTLSPGYIRTAMTDQLLAEDPEVERTWMAGALLGRLGAPEDFKAPSIFLLASGSSFMTGADLRVDGGHCASA